MNLFVNDDFVTEVDVEMERKGKVFEDIERTEGDFSYSFSLPDTAEIRKKLGVPSIDGEKRIYRKIDNATLNNASGIVYRGFVQVETIDEEIQASFFSGNNSWFDLLTGNLKDIFDNDPIIYNITNIVLSWNDTSKWFFPVIDAGALETRAVFSHNTDDFHPFYYVKDLVKKILGHAGIKLKGDLVNEWRYNHLIVSSGIKQDARILEYIVDVDQDVSIPVSEAGGPEALVGYTNNDYASYVRVTASVTMTGASGDGIRLGLEGSNMAGLSESFKYEGGGEPIALDFSVLVPASESLNLFIEVMNTGGSMTVTHVKATFQPLFIYSFQVNEILPNWTSAQFMANIFRLFNCIVSYEPTTKTITANLFERILDKEPIDLSPYISRQTYDFIEFIQPYGQKTLLTYQDAGLNDTYNNVNKVEYGSGVIEVNNDFIEKESPAVESEFSPPGFGFERIYKGNFPQFELVDLMEIYTEDITSITDSSGTARLNMASVNNFIAGVLIRVECENDAYNGDWYVDTVGVGYVECLGMGFIANSTGTAKVLRFEHDDTDDAFIMLAVPNLVSSNVSEIPSFGTNIGYAYFNLLRTGKGIDDIAKQSLSFGDVNNDGDYQQKLKDDYYKLFGRMLQDPVKLIDEMYIPYHVFLQMDSQRPAIIKTKDTSNMYYISRITGYKSSDLPCTVELIKLKNG